MCFNKTRLNIVRTNYLFDWFETAMNDTALLGEDFIDSCPVLANNEDAILVEITGAYTCP